MTLPRRIFVVLISVSVLLGQLPHQSVYCSMMKHTIDTRMLLCCMKHRSADKGQSRHRITSTGMMKVLAKPTLCAFEHYRSDSAFFSGILPVEYSLPEDLMLFTEQTIFENPQRLPPDLTIINLNLRI